MTLERQFGDCNFLKVTYRKRRKLCGSFIIWMTYVPTLDIMWFLSVRFLGKNIIMHVQINEGVHDFYCAINHCPAQSARIKSTHNFLLLRYILVFEEVCFHVAHAKTVVQ